MPKIFPDDQRDEVIRLHEQKLNYTDIAKKMAARYPDHWDFKNAHRAASKIIKEHRNRLVSVVKDTEKTLDEMTREERFGFIQSKLKNTPRFKMAFRNFTNDEKELFVDEYLSILKETDSLTSAEEQMLFTGIFELILAFQAIGRKQREEDLYQRTINGEFQEGDAQFRRFVDDKYQKEYDQHMKLYQKTMTELKMSRKERLDKVKTERRTLVDLAEELSSKTAQADAAAHIEELSKLRDEELKSMIENKYIHGVFED
jgi:hypothetical protein